MNPRHFIKHVAVLPRFIAVFRPQAWANDYAVDVEPEGPARWEVTGHLRSLNAEERAKVLAGHDYESDALRELPGAPQWVQDWTGPFEVDVFELRSLSAEDRAVFEARRPKARALIARLKK